MTNAAPGPYDEALKNIGNQINALTAQLDVMGKERATKAELDEIRAELAEAKKERADLLKTKPAPAAPAPSPAPAPAPAPEDDSDGLRGFYDLA